MPTCSAEALAYRLHGHVPTPAFLPVHHVPFRDQRARDVVTRQRRRGIDSVPSRAYNNGYSRGIDSNHRITANVVAIQEVLARGWVDEGVVMCAPG